MRIIKTDKYTFKIPDYPVIKTNKGELKLPVMSPIIVPSDMVQANNYNPNHVDDNNMKLLETSILENGFTFGIVTVWEEDIEKFVIVDGFHRSEILK